MRTTKKYVVGLFSLYFIYNSKALMDEDITLMKAFEQLNATVTELRHSNDILNATVQQSEMKITALKQEVNRLAQGTTPPIIFHAYLSSVKQVGPDQTIEYDKVLTNVGNAYDPRHGHFTASVDGYYHFSATIMSIPNEELYVNMVKNGVTITSLYGGNNDFASSSQSINIQLAAGDMVWLKQPQSSIHTLDGGYCTFSGNIISTIV